jgi:type II secretory pathway component PulF
MSGTANTVATIANILATSQPLVPGLRAAAADVIATRQARLLTRLADLLEQGVSLPDALRRERAEMPVELNRILSLDSPALRQELLVEWSEQQRMEQQSLRQLRTTLHYPTLLLWLTSLVILFLYLVVARDLARFNQDTYDSWQELGFMMPSALSDWAAWTLFGLLLVGPLLLILVQVLGGVPIGTYLSSIVPGVSGIQQWLFLARTSRSLAILLDSGLPLPEALQLLADDPCRRRAHGEFVALQRDVAGGMPLSEALAAQDYWPSSICLFARRGESLQQLPTTLRGAAELYELRADLRTRWLRKILPSLVFLIVGQVTLSIYSSWTLPLVRMIAALSSGGGLIPGGGVTGGGDLQHPLHLAGMLLVGISTQIATNLVFAHRGRQSLSFLQQILNLIAGTLCVLSLFAMLFSLASWLSLLCIILLIAWMIESFLGFRLAERRALLAHLTLAAEHGISWSLAARAYGLEQGQSFIRRANRLAQALDDGMPLLNALRLARYRLTAGQQLAVAVGTETGDLGRPLREALRAEEESRTTFRWLYEKLAYLALVFVVVGATSLFLSINIIPVFRTMLSEFGVRLTSSTSWAFDFVGYFPWLVGLTFFFIIGPLLTILGMPLGFADLPILGRMTMKHDGAWVLRGLSWMIHRDVPIPQALKLIATYFPKRRVRRAVAAVQGEAERGGSWSLTLSEVGLVRRADAMLLTAAQRVGNLTWSLRETADATLRRIAIHIRALSQFLFPLAIVLLALFVVVAAYAVFSPLIQLLEAL